MEIEDFSFVSVSLVPLMPSIQLTLEQHRFDLHGSTNMEIFLNKCVLLYDTICTWLTSWMCNRGYRGTVAKIYMDF